MPWFLIVGTCFSREVCSCRNPPLGVRWKTRHCWKRRILCSGGISLMHTGCFAVGKVKERCDLRTSWFIVCFGIAGLSELISVLHCGFPWQDSKGWACCLRCRSCFPVLSISELPFLGTVLSLRFRTMSRCCTKLYKRAVSPTNSWAQGMEQGLADSGASGRKVSVKGGNIWPALAPKGQSRLTRRRAQHFKPSPWLC